MGTANKMTVARLYFQNKRVATGKMWKNKFLQVYPVVKEFDDRTEWCIAWQRALNDSIKMIVDHERPVPEAPPFRVAVAPLSPPPAAASPPPLPPSPPPSSPSAPPKPSTKDWSYRKELTFTAPAGKYYIGDLCYALYDNIYDNVFGGRGYESGIYTKGSSFFMVDSTAYGDGDYEGSDGFHYLVDAGIIGICSEDMIDPNNPSWKEGGKIHTFTQPVEIRFNRGIFYFNSGYTYLRINTEAVEYDSY